MNASESQAKNLIIALVALLLVGIGVLVFLRLRGAESPPPAAEGGEIAEAFLSQLATGKAIEAWESTTAEFKSAEGRESFVRKMRAAKLFKQTPAFASSQPVKVGEAPRTEVLFNGPQGEQVRILLGPEQGVWKVDRLTY